MSAAAPRVLLRRRRGMAMALSDITVYQTEDGFVV